MIVTVSGLPGAGSTSLARDLSKVFNWKLITMGEMFKQMAKEKGLSSGQEGSATLLLEKQKKNKSFERFHREFDKMQKKAARRYKNCIINGKLSAFVIKDADVRIFLKANERIRAKRIAKREGVSYRKALRDIRRREKIERREWKRIYNVDYAADLYAYDLVMDTSYHKIKDSTDIAVIFIKAIRRSKK
ncbi:cytidylate kinase [Candidatus Micrarchaeota archaeon]|nr:MAG: cytidylate kinase [Candidatus Micrarchaeota archaeon]